MSITVSEANYEDVLKLRHEVMYPDKDIEFVKLPDDDKAIHVGAFEAGKLMAVCSLFMHENRSLQFRKLATRKDAQGKGYASALLKWINDYALDIKLSRLWCNARIDALEFYKKDGFEEIGEKISRNGYDYIVVEKREKE